jgi:hypothetical protein
LKLFFVAYSSHFNFKGSTVAKLFFSALVLSALTSLQARAQSAVGILDYPKAGLQAELTWLENSPVVGPESRMLVQWRNAQGEAVSLNGDFRVVLFMPDMGHGSSPTKIAKLPDTVGLYRVTKMYFTMPGVWEVKVTLKLADTDPETSVTTLELAGD